MIKRKINFPLKLIIASLIIFMALFFIIRKITRTLVTLDYFKIKEVMVSPPEIGFNFSYLVGRNIFSLDLGRETRYISELYPTYKRVILVRILPDRLYIGFTQRKPQAIVKLYRYFYVDNDRVLFDMSTQPEGADLPVIVGLETKIFGAKPGKQYNLKELTLALDIIKEVRLNSTLKRYRIKRIDVASPSHTSFFIQLPDNSRGQTISATEVLELKIGQDGIRDKIGVLGDLLQQLEKDLSNIRYIDLRFKEPAIKFKDAK